MVFKIKKERDGKLNTTYEIAKAVPAAIDAFCVCTDGGCCKMMTLKGEKHTIWTRNTRGVWKVLVIVLYSSKLENIYWKRELYEQDYREDRFCHQQTRM